MRVISIALIIGLCAPGIAQNETRPDPPLAGFSASVFNGSRGCNFELYQLHGIYTLTDLYRSTGLSIPIGFEVMFGLLHESSCPALLVHGNLQLGAAILKKRLTFAAGSGPAMISRFRFPNRNLGSYSQFISFIGLRAALVWRIGAGVRFQHLSNGDLNRQNPGLNMVVAEINYRFVTAGEK